MAVGLRREHVMLRRAIEIKQLRAQSGRARDFADR
jgi:hypothetical protein